MPDCDESNDQPSRVLEYRSRKRIAPIRNSKALIAVSIVHALYLATFLVALTQKPWSFAAFVVVLIGLLPVMATSSTTLVSINRRRLGVPMLEWAAALTAALTLLASFGVILLFCVLLVRWI